MPPASSHVLIDSAGRTPPSPQPQVEEDFCNAPAEGLYSYRNSHPDGAQGEAIKRIFQNYGSLANQRIETMWEHGMPRAANDPWLHKAVVTVRFAILPSGEIDPPIVTVSSGRASYDHHALEAIRQAAPFGPMPAGVDRPIPICYRFGYHVSRQDMLP